MCRAISSGPTALCLAELTVDIIPCCHFDMGSSAFSTEPLVVVPELHCNVQMKTVMDLYGQMGPITNKIATAAATAMLN